MRKRINRERLTEKLVRAEQEGEGAKLTHEEVVKLINLLEELAEETS